MNAIYITIYVIIAAFLVIAVMSACIAAKNGDKILRALSPKKEEE
jgi:hypothetical protein